MSQSVQKIFSTIASRYDLANDVLSFGVHRLWRKSLVNRLKMKQGHKVLDLCCGTGDLAFESAKKVAPDGRVIALDFVDEMLEIAKNKSKSRKFKNVDFMQGDAMKISSANSVFDFCTIGFGIRNVDDPLTCLKEIKRCLKNGAKLGVLEFGQPTLPGFKQAFRFYSDHIMPIIGGLVTGQKQAYKYLPETSKEFVAGEDFLELMKQAGFRRVKLYPHLWGLAYSYIAEK